MIATTIITSISVNPLDFILPVHAPHFRTTIPETKTDDEPNRRPMTFCKQNCGHDYSLNQRERCAHVREILASRRDTVRRVFMRVWGVLFQISLTTNQTVPSIMLEQLNTQPRGTEGPRLGDLPIFLIDCIRLVPIDMSYILPLPHPF